MPFFGKKMFQYFRARSRLEFFEVYLSHASPKDLGLLETNFAMYVFGDMPDLFKAEEISQYQLYKIIQAMVNWHNIQLSDFEAQDCDLSERKRTELMGMESKIKNLNLCLDRNVLLKCPLMEIHEFSTFFALRILTAYLMYFFYIGVRYKSLRRRIMNIMSILQKNRNREKNYDEIYKIIFPKYIEGKVFYAKSGLQGLEELLQPDPDDDLYHEVYSARFVKDRKDKVINLDFGFIWKDK